MVHPQKLRVVMAMLLPRVLSAVVLVPLGLVLAYFGGLPFAVVVWALATIGLWEFAQGMRKINIFIIKEIAFPCVLVGLIGTHFWHDQLSILFLLWVAVLLVALFGSMAFHIVYRRGEQEIPLQPGWRIASIGATVLGVLYLSMFAFPILLRHWVIGRDLFFLLLFTVWATDITAYFVGQAIGKRKLAPQVSPGKTLEGSLSGLVGGVVIAALVAKILPHLPMGVSLPLTKVLPLALVISIAGQVGDLCKSVLKRDIGIKDFGALIPGHGGVLDRFDSLLISAPLVYFYAQAFRL